MEQQKETYKKDLIESQKKFEITLEQLQKRGSIDKDKQENSQQALIRVLESKYSAKIRDLLDQHQQQLAEEKSKWRRLEAEHKALSDRLLLEQKGKQTEQVSLEKRVADLQETERRLQGEIEEMRQERDRRSQDYQRLLDKEKDAYRQRLAEVETKCKDAEKMRSQHMFEYEKERARWQLEKDQYMCKL